MINHVPILRNEILNRKLFEVGYAVLPFLNREEVDFLRKEFYRFHTEDEVSGLYVTASHKESETVKLVSESIKEAFKRAIAAHIENGLTLGGTFITKPANETEPLQPHQDWSIVDESKFRSFTIWTPLDDVDDFNGAMYVLPRSHETMRGYRHVTIPSVYGEIYDHVWKHMTPIHLKAGEALIFDHALAHASKPNRSDSIRIAATHSLLSPDSEMRFYWNNNGTVEEFYGQNEFYNTEAAKVGPGNLKKIRDVDFEIKQLDQNEFNTLAGVETQQKQLVDNETGVLGWVKRIFS